MKFDEIVSEVVKHVKEEGLPVLRNTPYCEQYYAAHGNCNGCESIEGCRKVAETMMKAQIGALFDTMSEFGDCNNGHDSDPHYISVNQIGPDELNVCAAFPPDEREMLCSLLARDPDLQKWHLSENPPEKCLDHRGRWHYKMVKEV